MDVMKPNIVWMKGRCYRLFGQILSHSQDARGYEDNEDSYEYDLLQGTDGSDNEFIVEPTDTGRFKSAFHVPRTLHGVLVGPKGSARQRLEKETKTVIRIPRKGLLEDIVVTGPTRENVIQARRRMELMILAARLKQPFTHFLTFPMNNDAVKCRFLNFKEQVLESCKEHGVNSDVFQDANKLHLTLGTLTLLDDVDRKQASSALQTCYLEVIKPLLNHCALRLRMYGVEIMNDDPAEVDVLYGKIEDISEVPVVQELANKIVLYMTQTGLMPKQHDAVKLHVTLMNSKFRPDDKIGNNELDFQKKRKETFNSTEILKKFHEFDFGEISIKSIDLSRRYSSGSDGYYEATASIAL